MPFVYLIAFSGFEGDQARDWVEGDAEWKQRASSEDDWSAGGDARQDVCGDAVQNECADADCLWCCAAGLN